MKIAIIGTGNVGGALGGSLAKAGHSVTFAGQDAEKAATVAQAAGATSASVADAIAGADAVVLAVPGSSAPAVAAANAAALAGKTVIDATNPLKADYSGLATGPDSSNAELIAAAAPGARIVKAFNTVFAGNMADAARLGTSLDALYATDDEVARAAFREVASAVGFRPVHVGPLAAARELEAMAWLNIRLQFVTNGYWQSSFGLVGAPEAALA